MTAIQAFTSPEKYIIEQITEMLRNRDAIDDYVRVDETHLSLLILAESISRYPSILQDQHLGQNRRTVDTLVQNLCSHPNLNLVLNTPTKAVLGRGFTIAKINFFLLVSYLCSDNEGLCMMLDEIQDIITHNVFSMMTEDVFISIVSDDSIEYETRIEAGYFLTKIWENRIYKGIEEISPVLNNLWKNRLNFIPAYGTLAGISEIATFCSRSNPEWNRFIEDDDFTDDTLESLREYLMGLSHEEMLLVQDYMEKNSIISFNRDNISGMLGRDKSYAMINYDDPREMYHFYSRRKENAEFRKKSRIKGPSKTIEEYLVCYMIRRGMIRHNGV
ncbi:MAG TPA: hypothetical protein P5120_00930 [Spirochaetota bacterium]|nr:hypothetical protein [Spirochaetota bacterium]HRX46056.1 hypothetical protein [Spirochaetota bacterium]